MPTPQTANCLFSWVHLFLFKSICWLRSNGHEPMSSKFPFTELLFLITLSLAHLSNEVPVAYLTPLHPMWGKKASKAPLKTNGRLEMLISPTQANIVLASILSRCQVEMVFLNNFLDICFRFPLYFATAQTTKEWSGPLASALKWWEKPVSSSLNPGSLNPTPERL